MQEIMEKIYATIIPYVFSFAYALVIFIVGRWVARIISRGVDKSLQKGKVEKTLASFIRNAVYFAILTFVVLAALGKLGIQTTSFIAVIGAAGFAVGLALQGSLSNFAAGALLIIFKPFKVDDLVEAGGALGRVHEIQIFNTIIHSSDGKIVIVPNAKITGDKIVVYPKDVKK